MPRRPVIRHRRFEGAVASVFKLVKMVLGIFNEGIVRCQWGTSWTFVSLCDVEESHSWAMAWMQLVSDHSH